MEGEKGKSHAAKSYEWLYIINTFVFSILNHGVNFQAVVEELTAKVNIPATCFDLSKNRFNIVVVLAGCFTIQKSQG